jgi:hypothetical protein
MKVNVQLPYFGMLPCMPFTGMVYNSGVSTLAHKDGMDLGFCAVMPFGEWEGADLVLYDIGVVWSAKPDMLIFFLSDCLTHFNTVLKGVRCSMVFNVDFMLAKWAKDQNNFINVNVHPFV